MSTLTPLLVGCILVAALYDVAAENETSLVSAPILVYSVSGDASVRESPNASFVPVSSTLELVQGAEVQVGSGSMHLLFPNGAEVILQENTLLVLKEILQLGNYRVTNIKATSSLGSVETLGFSDVEKEPSWSQTKLSLIEGSILVKTPILDRRSTFQIQSALGITDVTGVSGVPLSLGFIPATTFYQSVSSDRSMLERTIIVRLVAGWLQFDPIDTITQSYPIVAMQSGEQLTLRGGYPTLADMERAIDSTLVTFGISFDLDIILALDEILQLDALDLGSIAQAFTSLDTITIWSISGSDPYGAFTMGRPFGGGSPFNNATIPFPSAPRPYSDISGN